jgi:CRISPR/Cas system CSM-associated protein Csm3 (group 7 of RAMP superfamily)
MKSNLSIWHDVETGKLDPQKALKLLEKFPMGGNDTQTYRRIKKFIGSKQKPKEEPEEVKE